MLDRPPVREESSDGLVVVMILIFLAVLAFSAFNVFFGPTPKALAVSNKSCAQSYTVQRGDTQAGVAQRFGVSEATLVEANPTLKIAFAPGLLMCIPGAANAAAVAPASVVQQGKGGLPPQAAAPVPQVVACIDTSLPMAVPNNPAPQPTQILPQSGTGGLPNPQGNVWVSLQPVSNPALATAVPPTATPFLQITPLIALPTDGPVPTATPMPPVVPVIPNPAAPAMAGAAYPLAANAALPGHPAAPAEAPVICGSPASLVMYDAGLTLGLAEYDKATLYSARLDPATLPAAGLYFLQPLFQGEMLGAAGQMLPQPRTQAYIHFDISTENLSAFNLNQMAIYFLNPELHAWVPCPGLAQVPPGPGAGARLTCPLTRYGTYGVAVQR